MSINENLKNAFYISVGLALKGKETIETAAKDFVEKHKMNKEEGEAFIKDVASNLEAKRNDAQDFIKTTIKNAANEIGFVRRSEYDELNAKYEELKSKIDEMQNQ